MTEQELAREASRRLTIIRHTQGGDGHRLEDMPLMRDHSFGPLVPDETTYESSGCEVRLHPIDDCVMQRWQLIGSSYRLEGVAGLIFSPPSPVRAGGSRIVHLSSDLRWMPRDRLNASRPHPHLEPFYDQHVARKPVLQPVDARAAFIMGLQ